MEVASVLVEQVREILIQTEDKKPRHEIYNQFINECRANNLSEDDFYKKILKTAHKSVDWNYIEEEKKRKKESQKKLDSELAEHENLIQSAPIYIERLIKTVFEDGIVESDELKKIFEKAEKFSQDLNELARKIDAVFDEKKYKSYPKANLDSPTLKDMLCSSNWYNEEHYKKLTALPTKPFPWKAVGISILLIIVILGFWGYTQYNYNLKSKESEIKLSIEKTKQDSIEFERRQVLLKQKIKEDSLAYVREIELQQIKQDTLILYKYETENKVSSPVITVDNSDSYIDVSRLIGNWKGKKVNSDKDITIFIDRIEDGNVIGYNIVGTNKRPVLGLILQKNNSGCLMELKEPGSDKWDGVFTINFNIDQNQGTGMWKSNNGQLSWKFNITKPFSSSIPGLYPMASERMLTSRDLSNLSKEELKIMRNEIFARHGYIFKSRDMKNYFSNQNWYNPQYSDVNSKLSKIENSNIQLIKKYE